MRGSDDVSGIEAITQDPLHALERTAERIRFAHEATMRAAARIRVDAERMRAAAADERTLQMAALAETVSERAEAIAHQCERLARVLDGALAAARRIEGRAAAAPAPPIEAPEPSSAATAQPPLRTRRFWRRGWRASRAQADDPQGLRLLATRMAIAGSSRLEIERRLRSEFGAAAAERALEAIFPEGAANGGGR